MSYFEVEPSAPLRRWVRCLWVNSGVVPTGDRSTQRILPDGCADIIVDLGDAPAGGPGERAYAVGTMTRPLRVERIGRVDYLGVRFRPGRAQAFLGIGTDEITDRRVALRDLFGADAARWEERIAGAADARGRVTALQELLVQRLRKGGGLTPSRLVDAAVERLEGSGGGTSVTTMADAWGVSRQHLTRIFRRRVGVPPKLFARVVRFRAALERARERDDRDWVRIAQESGYYDQSHLIADFRKLAGATPTEIVTSD